MSFKEIKEIIEWSIDKLDKKPEAVHGYEENMRYLKEMSIGNYLKYGNYRNEKNISNMDIREQCATRTVPPFLFKIKKL